MRAALHEAFPSRTVLLDLFVMRNVVMNPYQTEKNFIGGLMDYLESVIIEKVKSIL